MNPLYLLGGVAALFVTLLAFSFLTQPNDEVERLRARYFGLLRMTPSEARLHLGDQLEALHKRFPDQTLAWYLRWLITDLERAKRP